MRQSVTEEMLDEKLEVCFKTIDNIVLTNRIYSDEVIKMIYDHKNIIQGSFNEAKNEIAGKFGYMHEKRLESYIEELKA